MRLVLSEISIIKALSRGYLLPIPIRVRACCHRGHGRCQRFVEVEDVYVVRCDRRSLGADVVRKGSTCVGGNDGIDLGACGDVVGEDRLGCHGGSGVVDRSVDDGQASLGVASLGCCAVVGRSLLLSSGSLLRSGDIGRGGASVRDEYEAVGRGRSKRVAVGRRDDSAIGRQRPRRVGRRVWGCRGRGMVVT